MSIKKILRLTLIIFSIVPIIIVSILAYQLISVKLVTITRDNLQQLAESNSYGLEAWIRSEETEISLLATQSQLYDVVVSDTTSISSNQDAIQVANNFLLERSVQCSTCESISLYNANKQIVASSDVSFVGNDYSNSATLSYVKATKGIACGVSGLIESVSNNNGTNYYLEIGYPIIKSGLYTQNQDDSDTLLNSPIVGYLISTIDISHFKDFLKTIVIGKTGYSIVLDKNGIILYHPEADKIGSKIDSDKLRNLVKNYYTGNLPKSGAFDYYQEVKQLYGYSVIPELDCVLLIRQDKSEIIGFANIILYVLIWTVVILILILLIVSDSFTRIYTNPIIKLKDVMRTASDGNLDVVSNIKSRNELGELSRSFNKMLHIIRSNYNELSAMHDELVTNEDQLRSNYNHIEYLAYHDVLTSLPNKLAFIKRVNGTLESSIGLYQLHAVYFVDLDNFKTINDTLGHDFGDDLLAQTAEALLSVTSSDDILARAGGDEFLIFRENLDTQTDITNFAKSIIEAFKKPFNLNGEISYVSMSIGIAIYPKNGTSINTLIKNADIAMYKSKETGKSKYTLFDNSMEDELNRNTLILDILRDAIQNHEVYACYQPQFNIANNKIIGFEALMRINSSKLGSLSPTEFIPIAEESGLIVDLGEWILREACYFNKNLLDQGFPPYIVSVNISSVQINRPGFITMLDDVLNETGLPPEYLELEITESSLVSSLVDATTLLHNLQSLGVRISLDDFGTGYSSLNYLTSMPINTLKIDKSFIDNISNNSKDSYIAETIIQLAHSIDIEVIAEGVEYIEQLEILKLKNCDIVQGFIYSKPLLPDTLISILE